MGSNIETPNQEASHEPDHTSPVSAALNDAEAKATDGPDTKGDAARQEAAAKFGEPKGLYARSREQSKKNRKRGGPRGLFIGLGAGGGIVSVIAGFSFMLPFKLPGIMDPLIGDAGKRLEKAIERRAERVFLQFVLRGTNAAKLNGNLIETRNPIGDYFANLKTANFEVDLKEQFGLEFKPGPNKTVTLVHDGRDLGNANSPDDILKILDSGKSLSRADLRKIIRATNAWPFYKRAKFVKWLRLKYDIPRFGAREMQAGETEAAYNSAVMEEHVAIVQRSHFRNFAHFFTCIASGGNCESLDKTGAARKMFEDIQKTITETTKELATKGLEKIGGTVLSAAMPKIALLASTTVGGIGAVNIVVLIYKTNESLIRDNLLQTLHADYVGYVSTVTGAAFAGYADQNKAGDLLGSTAGMFGDRLTGWEESVSYNYINEGKRTGTELEEMEKVGESFTNLQYASAAKKMFNISTAIIDPFMDAWFNTVSRALDFLGEKGSAALQWLTVFSPAQILMEKLAPYIAAIMEGMLKFIGMYIDPLAIGAKLAMYIHQGFLHSFNLMSKELGMRLLNHAQGMAMDNEIRDDRIADLADMSLYDRLLNLNNSSSLATTLAASMPGSSNPVLAFATSSTRLVANAPNNFAKVTTATSYAADDVTSEEIFGVYMYGGTAADLSAELSPTVQTTKAAECPENRDDRFNHCKVDLSVVEAMNCSVVKNCPDMTTTNLGEFDQTFADDGYTAPTFTRVTNPISDLFKALPTTIIGARKEVSI